MLAGMQSLLMAAKPAPHAQEQQERSEEPLPPLPRPKDAAKAQLPRPLLEQLRGLAPRKASEPGLVSETRTGSAAGSAGQEQQGGRPGQLGGSLMAMLKNSRAPSPPCRGPVSAALALAKTQNAAAPEMMQAAQQQQVASPKTKLERRMMGRLHGLPQQQAQLPETAAAALIKPLPEQVRSSGLLAPFLASSGSRGAAGERPHSGAGSDDSETHSWQPRADEDAGMRYDDEDAALARAAMAPSGARATRGAKTGSPFKRKELQADARCHGSGASAASSERLERPLADRLAVRTKPAQAARGGGGSHPGSSAASPPTEPGSSPRPTKRLRTNRAVIEPCPLAGAPCLLPSSPGCCSL